MLRTNSSLFALALLAPGCVFVIDGDKGPDYDDTGWGYACDEMAVSSVMVSIVDPSGNPTSATSVWYTSSASEWETPAECMDADCKSWVAGWEISGEITVHAELYRELEDSACWYEDQDEQTVFVPMTADGCHVETQSLTLVLDPSLMVCPED